jgi:hypothetical protein
MATVNYQINGLVKLYDEDSFEKGAIPDSGGAVDVDLSFKAETPDGVIEKCAEFLGVKKDGIERNPNDDYGRVDFCLTEDSNSTPLSKSQYEQWKKGEIKAYAVEYIAQVEMVISGIPL